MTKCRWCGKKENRTYIVVNINDKYSEEVCSDSCRTRFIAAMARFEKYKMLYLGGILAGILIPVFALMFGIGREETIAPLPFIIVGITVVVFPYTTPETTHFLGMKKAAILARFLGGGLMIWGLSLIL